MCAAIPDVQPTASEVMTAAEVAKLTGRSRRNIYQLAKEDRLPFPVLRIGRSIVFQRAAVQAWLSGELVTR
jgi:excisionase family DNA binding protein